MIDLHAHPSLKMYYLPYLRATLHALVYSGGHFNPFSFRNSYRNLRRSPVKVVVNAHYPIEKAFVGEGFKWFFRYFAWTFGASYYGKLRFAEPWKTLQAMMKVLEASTANTNRWRWLVGGSRENRPQWHLLKDVEAIEALAEEDIGVLHAIEGGHALGFPKKGQSKPDFWRQTRGRLAELKKRGVCMITLAHFYDNPFSPQTDGTELIPKRNNGDVVVGRDDAFYFMKRAEWRWGDPDKLAEELVRELMEIGILVDVVHTQEHARWKIYDLAEHYERPVVASHVGLQHFFEHEYNLSDAELRRFHELGGIVGLILSKRWLLDPITRYHEGKDGVPNLIASMQHVADVTGDISSIGVGTDFDGLTDPFTDCYTPAHLYRVVHAMSQVFTDDQIDQILYRNALRVLRTGWAGSEASR